MADDTLTPSRARLLYSEITVEIPTGFFVNVGNVQVLVGGAWQRPRRGSWPPPPRTHPAIFRSLAWGPIELRRFRRWN